MDSDSEQDIKRKIEEKEKFHKELEKGIKSLQAKLYTYIGKGVSPKKAEDTMKQFKMLVERRNSLIQEIESLYCELDMLENIKIKSRLRK